MGIPTISIVTDPDRISWAEVFINGVRLNGVRSIQVTTGAEQTPEITLKIACKLETLQPKEDQPNAE
jgi:hypothetical protein